MSNRLAGATSPYLRQHAGNPVDWYPWGEEALALARAQDRPILLSVGYSACHWCHVMAHESFEDADVAGVMNRLFVNIKVDREERPDLDHIYQAAHQVLTQRAGGWPLTVFLTPSGEPFFAGTYFPKHARYNLPGFPALLERVAVAYRERRDEIAKQNEELLGILRRTVPTTAAPGWSPTRAPIVAARNELMRLMDPVHGGLGGAPKFPHPQELSFLLRHGVLERDEAVTQAVVHTLKRMAEGGLYDHVGGGFCRYSVDAEWSIPHFEKMLYDNGPLLGLYADAWQVTRDATFERVCRQTAAWVMREMQVDGGGYASSLDADAEGEEGRFYVWTPAGVDAVLSHDESRVIALRFGLDGAPNFESRHWHFRVSRSWADVATATGIPDAECRNLVDVALPKLLDARERRIRPARDDKRLTSWNALMIGGMARAARVFGRDDWLASARGARDFLYDHLWHNGRLLATHMDGRSHLNAYLDDYAFLVVALLELMQTDFRAADLHWAVSLADVLLDAFEDRQGGGFWFTSHDHESLILRPKPALDDATPSGNGMAAMALQRLGHLVGDSRYGDAAERALRLHSADFTRQAAGMPSLMTALEECLSPSSWVIVRGPQEALARWGREIDAAYRPGTMTFRIPAGVAGLPAVLEKPVAEIVNAWVCRGVVCMPPVGSAAEVLAALTSA